MKKILQIWLISLLVKVVLATIIPLSQDEAYYWVWSHHLQLSYFDHPGMVSWLFWLGHPFENWLNAVRVPAVLIGHLTLLIWTFILNKYYDLKNAQYWLWFILLCPLTGLGGVIVTPDLPLILFWSLSVLLFLQALETQESKYYALLGASLGLGFCSKYHIVLFVPFALLYLLFEKKFRALSFKKFCLLVFCGIIFSSPVLIWNIQQNFASFKFQLAHGLQQPDYEFSWTLAYLGGQFLLLSPFIFIAALNFKIFQKHRFIYYLSWGPLLFFFFTSFKAMVEANWPIAAYPGIAFLAAVHPQAQTILKRTLYYWITIYIIIAVMFIMPRYDFNAKLKEPFQMQPIVSLVNEYKPLYASTYQMASTLWFLTKTPVYKLQNMNRHDFFDTIKESKPTANHFYLVMWYNDTPPSWLEAEGYRAQEIKKIDSDFILLEIKRE